MANRIKLAGTTVPEFQVGLRGATISSSAVTAPYSLVLPPSLGTTGQALALDSTGNLAFIDPSAGSIANGNASISVLSDGTVVLPDTGALDSPTMFVGESSVQMGSNLPNLHQSRVYVDMTAGQISRIVALSSVTQTGGFAAGATVSGTNLVENTVSYVQTIGSVKYFSLDFEPSAVPQVGDELTFTLAAQQPVTSMAVAMDGYQDSFTPPRLYIEYDPSVQTGDLLLDSYPYPYGTIITNVVEDMVDFPGQWYIETDQVPDTIPSYGDYITVYRDTLHVDTGTVGSPAANHLPYYNANGVVPSTGAILNGPNVTDESIISNWMPISGSGVLAVTPSITVVDDASYSAVYINSSEISSSVIIGDNMSMPSVTAINRSVFVGSNISGNLSTYDNSVSIGYNSVPSQSSVSIGSGANTIGSSGVAVGVSSSANTSAVAIGQSSNANASLSIAIGYATTASASQGIAIGTFTNATGANGIALGRQSGASAADSIRMGFRSGISSSSAVRSIAIGYESGEYSQGANAIAIGAFAGSQSQANNSIVLNASGADLNNTTANSFVVKPVRNATTSNVMYYNNTSGEISYGALSVARNNVTGAGNIGQLQFSDASGNLTSNDRFYIGLNATGGINSSRDSAGFGVGAISYHNTALSSSIVSGRARGTKASPLPVQVGDRIGGIYSFPYTGNGAQTLDAIGGWVTSTGPGISMEVTSLPTGAGNTPGTTVRLFATTSATNSGVSATLAEDGTFTVPKLTVSGTSNLGAVGNVKISGGALSTGQALVSDSAGNLSWGIPKMFPVANTTSNTAVSFTAPFTWSQLAASSAADLILNVYETTSVDSKPALVGTAVMPVSDIPASGGFYIRVYQYGASRIIGQVAVTNLASTTGTIQAYFSTPLFYNAKLYIR